MKFGEWRDENVNEAAEGVERAKAWALMMKEAILKEFPDSIIAATPRQVNNGTLMVKLKAKDLMQSVYDEYLESRLIHPIDVPDFLNKTSAEYAVRYSSMQIQQGRTSHPIREVAESIEWLKKRFVEDGLYRVIHNCRPDTTFIPKGLYQGYELSKEAIAGISNVIPAISKLSIIDPAFTKIISPLFVFSTLLILDPEIPENLKEAIEKMWISTSYVSMFRAGVYDSFDVKMALSWKEKILVRSINVKFSRGAVSKAMNCSAEKFAGAMEEPYSSKFLKAFQPDIESELLEMLQHSRGKFTAKKFGF